MIIKVIFVLLYGFINNGYANPLDIPNSISNALSASKKDVRNKEIVRGTVSLKSKLNSLENIFLELEFNGSIIASARLSPSYKFLFIGDFKEGDYKINVSGLNSVCFGYFSLRELVRGDAVINCN